ncbi:MAG TPA: glycosyltransferase family 4 protein [Chryseolinea sp.]|nr:glycosyltransferase family 4 protein [Chryseolinea sp.]
MRHYKVYAPMNMRIVNLTYALIRGYNKPESWLKRLDFYTAQLEALRPFAETKSIHLIDYEGILVKHDVEYHFLKLTKWQLLFPVRLHRYVDNLKPDVVVIQGLIFPWQVLWLTFHLKRKVKLVAVHHAERPLRFPKSLLQKVADRFIHAYFFAAVDLGKRWVDKGQISSLNKIHEIMEVSSFFYPTNVNDLLQRRNNYLWVGRLDDNKDPATLVKAFARFLQDEPSATLKIVYRAGNHRDDIERLLTSLEIDRKQIVLIENVDHDEMLHWYNDAAFVISTSHYEGSGAAVCEGMACGCIPIVTNIPSFRMMTQSGKVGFLFAPGDVNGLHQALRSSRQVSLLDERKKVLTQFQENLSCDAISKKMFQVISEK